MNIYIDILFKVFLSVIFGLIIGYEREHSGKSVGIRTLSLICLGSTLFCIMSPTIFGGDNSRIVAQVVSGIGFLGAGIIFKNGDEVHGLTTAATVWATAAVGALVGVGMYVEAFIGTLAILFINVAFKYFKKNLRNTNDYD